MVKPSLNVVAGILIDPTGNKVCLAQRAEHKHQGGRWEFPGGKIEAGEIPEAALARELKEELGIEVSEPQAYKSMDFEYPDKWVSLSFYIVRHFSGEPAGMEGQSVAWFDFEQLVKLDIPDANYQLVNELARQHFPALNSA